MKVDRNPELVLTSSGKDQVLSALKALLPAMRDA